MAKVGIIGAGISGMAAGYLLSRSHDVQLFEENDYLGGHTHTHNIDWQGQTLAIDTGFIVYNEKTYPNLKKLLAELGVATQPTEMSFSVRSDADNLEYNGHTLLTLFTQKRNLLRPRFYRLLYDIVRFNNQVKEELSALSDEVTLADYVRSNGYSRELIDWYLFPMAGAIWSAGTGQIGTFPMASFGRFFNNHGLLNINDRPVWCVVQGGSSAYVDKLTQSFAPKIKTRSEVTSVIRHQEKVEVKTAQNESFQFDEVVIATHSDQALKMLQKPTPAEQAVLGNMKYSPSEVVLHTDTSLLPRRRGAWASWNYNLDHDRKDEPTVTYSMNILQGLTTPTQFCVTLNNTEAVARDKILRKMTYWHPVYDREMLSAQGKFPEVSGVDRIHYCGAYWFNGFHEDGLRSALRVAEFFGEQL